MRLDPAMRVKRAVGPAFRADRHRDRPFDRFDDVGKSNFDCWLRQCESAGGAAGAGEQSATGELTHQFLGGGERNSGFAGELGRA
jgi:hypothetical protein